MKSIYQQALGSDFQKLHPKIRDRFGFSSTDARACIGTGTMHAMWHGKPWTWPFLNLGASRRVMFPESENNTRFVIENYAYRDALGRETVTWIRTFDFAKVRRRFDAYMIFSTRRNRIVDYLGTHEHLAVDLDIRVDARGGLCIRSGEQRFYEHILGFRVPAALTGRAEVREWFDDDLGKFCIRVDVTNNRFGRLFGYAGTFDVAWIDVEKIPQDMLPLRYEARE